MLYIGGVIAPKVMHIHQLADSAAELDGPLDARGCAGAPQQPQTLSQQLLVTCARRLLQIGH